MFHAAHRIGLKFAQVRSAKKERHCEEATENETLYSGALVKR
jgi:hypothetical protein